MVISSIFLTFAGKLLKLKTIMATKAIIFARVSSVQQEYERQISDLMPVVKADGYSKDDIHIIKYKESATKNNFEQRQSVQELINLIDNNPIEIVYTSEISRLSRRSDVMYGVLKVITEHNICLYIDKPTPLRTINKDGSPNPTATVMLAFLQSVAEQESMIKTERTLSGIKQKRAEGRITASKIKLGYDRSKDNKPVINSQEAKAIRDIYTLYSEGTTVGEIWRKYEFTGIFPKLKRSSGEGRIKKLLHDKTYIGQNAHFQYPPIISKDLFDKVQETFKTRDFKKGVTKVVYYCQGLVRFGERMMTPNLQKKAYIFADKDNGHRYSISINVLDSLAKELSCGAVTILDDKTIKQRLKNLSEGLKMANLRVSECDSQLNSLEKQKDKVNTMFQTDKIGEADYNKRWQSIQDEIDRTLKIRNDNMDNIAKFKAMSEQFQDRLDTHKIISDESFKALTDPVEIKALVQKCIKRIDVSQLSANSYKIQVHYTDPSLDDNEVWYHYSVRGWKLELKYVCGEIVREMEWERRL